MKQNFMMRLTSRRFFDRFSAEEVSCLQVGSWDAVRLSLTERGFQERAGQVLARKDATLARTLSCDYVLQAAAEDVEEEILRQRERCRDLSEKGLDVRGKACYLVLLYKDRITEEDVRALKKGQTDALAFERSMGPQKIGGAMLLILTEDSTGTGFFCRASGSAGALYDHGIEVLKELFGEIC